MTDTQLKNSVKEILALGFLDDTGKRMEFKDDMDFTTTIKELILQLTNKDFFTRDTTAVLAEFGWSREGGIAKQEFTPEPENTLLQDIEGCERLKELKEIALSEPQFKKIRGRISSFDLDSLKLEMIRIYKEEDVKKSNPIEAFEADKVQTLTVQDFEKVHEQMKEEIENIPPEIIFGKQDNKESVWPDDFTTPPEEEIDIPYPEKLIGHGTINVIDIITRPPFNNLFQIDQNVLSNILISMKNVGYDPAYPVVLWMNTMIDGHTRLQAAIDAGIKEVPALFKEFKDEHEALEYAMHNQRDRRNITEAELLRCISVLDKPMTKEEAGAIRGEKKVPTHKQTAKTLGIGESKVTDARTVLKDEKITEEVKEGKKTLREGAEEIRKRGRKPKEPISEALTKVGFIIQVLKNNAGKEMKLASLLKDSQNMGITEDMMSLIMEVLTAVSLVKIEQDVIHIKKAIK